MLASLRKWISGRDQCSAAAVRGGQRMALIAQKIAHAQTALRAGERALADFMQRERAALQQAEAMLMGRIAAGAANRSAIDRAQSEVAGLAEQIGTISALMVQTAARLAVLKEAAIAGRAVRLEHLDHSGAVDQALADSGPEAADRLMARLPRVPAQAGCCTLFGGAAKLQLQIG